MSDDHEIMTSVLDWFMEIEEWLPGAHSMVGDIIYGPIPLSDANNLYDLADQWGRLADALNVAYEDVYRAADPILDNWSGDGAAIQFAEQWFAYLEGLRQTAESAAQMQRGVQNLGLEVELMKFMALLNLIMLAVSIYMLIAAAIPTGGGSLGAAPGLFMGTRLAINAAASKTVGKIASIAMRVVMRNLSKVFGRLPALATRAMPAGVRTALPTLTTAVAARVAPVLTSATTRYAVGRGARTVVVTTTGVVMRGTRAVAARGISRVVSNRMAAQAMRGVARREVYGTLASRSTAGVQRALAREIREQLLHKWTGRAIREGADEVITRIAQQQVAGSLGREFAGYVGVRVAFGAGFMGGGNLLGQFGQVVSGNRVEGVDWGQVGVGTLQGAVFGAGMFGGPLGHAIGGGLAGGGFTLGTELYQQISDGRGVDLGAVDWTAVGHHAAQGVAMGVIFGGQTHLENANIGGLGTRVGRDVHVLPGADGGFNIASSRSVRGGGVENLLLTSDGYVAFEGRNNTGSVPDGVLARPDAVQAMDRHWLGRDSASPVTQAPPPAAPQGGPRVEAPGVRSDTGAPVRTGGDGGAGGGGPRQNASGGGGTQGAPPLRGEGSGSSTIERVRVPAGDGPVPHDPGPAAGGRPGVDGPVPHDPEATRVDPEATRVDPEVARSGGEPSRSGPDPGPPVADRSGEASPNRADGDGPPARTEPGRSADGPVPSDRPGGDRLADGERPGGDRLAGGDRTGDGDRTPAGARDRDGTDLAPPGRGEGPSGARVDVDGGAARADVPPRDGEAAGRRDGDGSARAERGTRDGDPAVARSDDGPPPRDPVAARPDDAAAVRADDGAAVRADDGAAARADDGAPARPDEGRVASAGHETGVDPSPRSIEQGTVRFREHPEFSRYEQELREYGVVIRDRPEASFPEVIYTHVWNEKGTTLLRVEKEMVVLPDMRFIDFEHEMGHVRQFESGERFRDGPPSTAPPRREMPNGRITGINGKSSIENRVPIVEYHVRLEEVIRLIERRVDRHIIDEHLRGLDERAEVYKANTKGQWNKNAKWAAEHFWDIPQLQRDVAVLRAGLEAGPPPVRPDVPPVRSDGPEPFAKRSDAEPPRPADPAPRADVPPRDGDTPAARRDGSDPTPVTRDPDAGPRRDPDSAPPRDPDSASEAVRALEDPVRPDVPEQTSRDPDQETTETAETGGAIRPRDFGRQFEWAEAAYERFRADSGDVADIAANLADVPRADGRVGFTPAEIREIKSHLMEDAQPRTGSDGTPFSARFDADPDIAEAWIRLREGRHLAEDLVLLEHELAERALMRANPEWDYSTAHREANRLHNWEQIQPGRTGERYDTSWGNEPHGNSDRLSQDPGRRDSGGVSVRLPGSDGPHAGDRQVEPGGAAGGRDGGQDVRGRALEDPSARAAGEELAGPGVVRGVEPSRLVDVPGRVPADPVAAPHEVAAVLNAELGALVDGRTPDAPDRPYGAEWDAQAQTMRLRFGDGLEVDVRLQVNESVPPGRSIVVRPELAVVDGTWRQNGAAGIVLSSHVPADPVARAAHVQDALDSAFRTLHGEVAERLHLPARDPGADGLVARDPGADGPVARESVAPEALRVLEDPVRPDVPVRDVDSVGRHDATPVDAPSPAPLTPDAVRQTMAGRNLPEQLPRWAEEHLAARSETGAPRPKSPEEIEATVRDLAERAVDLVTPRPEVADGVRHTASRIEGTEFVPDGRPWNHPDVTVHELQHAATGVLARDFADGTVTYVVPDGWHVRVEMADGTAQHFAPYADRGMSSLAETTVRAGTPEDPHIVRVNDRVAADQLSRVWVHEITETLALRHAEQTRPQPHGVLRRAMAAIGRVFGGGDAAQPAPRVDPHAAARMNERVHLQRLHDWAHARPDEQARLSREIAGVERDLVTLGHPVEPLRSLFEPPRAPVPDGVLRGHDQSTQWREPNLARREPEGFRYDPEPLRQEPEPARYEPAPESTHDAHWTDRRWEAEGRRPSVDELIPETMAEAAKWEGAIRQEIARQVEGEYAGLRVEFDPWRDDPISVYRNEVAIRLRIFDGEQSVGTATRVFQREHDGRLVVRNSSLTINDGVQGGGFASRFNSHMIEWYRESGVSHIEVRAVKSGAYVWARSGFDWAPNNEGRSVRPILNRLQSLADGIDTAMSRWADGTADVAALRDRYGGNTPEELAANMRAERDAALDIIERAQQHRFGSAGYPTPPEIAAAGANGRSGRESMWIGKEALLNQDWNGVLPISDGVVQHPRADAPPITAARVPHPDSDFHAYARPEAETEAVRSVAETALNDLLVGRLTPDDLPPVAPGQRLSVEVVPADRMPDAAVARSVPVDDAGRALPDGETPPPGGGYRIEVSDRAAGQAVPRALAHEVAELQAIRQRQADGLDLQAPDVLRAVPEPTGRTLSPHDQGRLAEVDHLLRLREDPAHQRYADREIAALRDHLGLDGDSPSAAARRELAGDWLAARGHDPATVWGAPARGPEHATALAVEARTPDGVPDRAAVDRFVDGVPRLDVSARGVDHALEVFVRESIGDDGVRLQALAGGAGQGQSGAPVYLVRNENGQLVAVAKIFPGVEELVRELSALHRLGSPEFTTFGTPRVEGVATLPWRDGSTAGALVMSVAPGRSIFDMIGDIGAAADRPAALRELHGAVQQAATALAELHGRPEGTGGPVDSGFLRFNHGLARREAEAVAAFSDRLLTLGVEPGALMTRVNELIEAGLADPGGASLMHGDAHPGNLFWHPRDGITLIDAPHAHFAMNEAGRPIGTPARDYANMMERLAHFGLEARLSPGEVGALRATFAAAYQAGGGPPLSAAAVGAFTVRFALRDVLDSLTALRAIEEHAHRTPEDVANHEVLREQLTNESLLLRRALDLTVADTLTADAPPGRALSPHDQERLAEVDRLPREHGHDPNAFLGERALHHEWPPDPVTGYHLQQRDLDFVGLGERDLINLQERRAPLGMTPEVYRHFAESLYEALRLDGIEPHQVDIRIRGSSVDVYSGRHKSLPDPEDLADPAKAKGPEDYALRLEALERLNGWLGDDPNRPTSRPFDSMYRLGLDAERSDYDINISSGAMFERARAAWDSERFDGPMEIDHGYLNKQLAKQEFPNLRAWSQRLGAEVDREMSWAIFDEGGPKDSTHLGFYVHFQETDWVVRPPEDFDVPPDVPPAMPTGSHGFVEEPPSAWAEQVYLDARVSGEAVPRIAENTGIRPEVIEAVRQHLFANQHEVPLTRDEVVHGYFTVYESTAQLWHDASNGVLTGEPLANMRNLMAHEYVESKLMESGLPYQTVDPNAWIPDADGWQYFGYYSSTPGAHDLAPRAGTGRPVFDHWRAMNRPAPHTEIARDLSNLDQVVAEIMEVWRDIIPAH